MISTGKLQHAAIHMLKKKKHTQELGLAPSREILA
jgi:hypothetical protein